MCCCQGIHPSSQTSSEDCGFYLLVNALPGRPGFSPKRCVEFYWQVTLPFIIRDPYANSTCWRSESGFIHSVPTREMRVSSSGDTLRSSGLGVSQEILRCCRRVAISRADISTLQTCVDNCSAPTLATGSLLLIFELCQTQKPSIDYARCLEQSSREATQRN